MVFCGPEKNWVHFYNKSSHFPVFYTHSPLGYAWKVKHFYKMRQTMSFVPLFIFALAMIQFCEGAGETGTLTWGQSCNPSVSLQDNPSTRCDTSKRLSCDARSLTCVCHHEERDLYNSNTDRCETKVGKFCAVSDTFPTICVNNAICQPTTNFCVCEEGAELSDDGTECIKEDDGEANSATTTFSSTFVFQLAIITIFNFIIAL